MNKLNPPSSTLHVSNLSPQAYNYNNLYSIFTKYGEIENIQFYLFFKKNLYYNFIKK